ncbi:Ig-like domain-containing protein [Planococcus shenhongbingii]|uniref:Ig-like domain-containing protein n=1 Tax=Planococcus shenhongbingii TaxID=3058398 RepID=UPI0026204490|nr:Ig-like domain-containing protein [Planococcus sp. N016]WKA57790.1 Ig-like domain-containing protein [Planococcus sp. N016]
MKKLLLLFIGTVLLIPISFHHTAEASDDTFMDVIKIPDSEFKNLLVYDDQLITANRTSSRHVVRISSYSKTGELNWEVTGSGPGPYAIAEDRFVTMNKNKDLMEIYSTETGKVLKTVKAAFADTIPRIYINEKYIILSSISGGEFYTDGFAVYDIDGKFLFRGKADGFLGGALFNDSFVYQDFKGIKFMHLPARQQVWHVPLEAKWTHEHTLMPVDNVIFPRGFEKKAGTDPALENEIMLAVDVRTGTVLDKKDFGKYEDQTFTHFKEFGFLVNHYAEDIFNFYHFDGTKNMTLQMESPAIKQLKEDNFVSGVYYNSYSDLIASQQGLYYSKSYIDTENRYLFSSIKGLDQTGKVKFEKVLDDILYDIATTDSDKLFAVRGSNKGFPNHSFGLNVYDPNGALLDTIETEFIQYLESDGSNLYGYGGNTLYIFQESEAKKDETAPSAPSVNALDSTDTTMTGKAESGTKVYAYAGDGKIGEATAVWGAFSGRISRQPSGAEITVVAVDKAGNQSAEKIVKVIDKTAPPVPSVDPVGDNSVTVSGKAESGAKVHVYAGSKKLGEAPAKSGKYSMKIAKQKVGTTITAHAIDPAKNKSSNKNVKVVDKTAPAVPTVNPITSKTTVVSGKAEKSAALFIYNGTKKIGQGTVDSKGNFKVKIIAQKKGSSLKLYAQDKAGNKSVGKTVKVN